MGGSRVAPAGLLEQALRPATGVPAPRRPPAGGRVSGGSSRASTAVCWQAPKAASRAVRAPSSTLVPDDGVAVIVLANAYPGALPSAARSRGRSSTSSRWACRGGLAGGEQEVLEQAALGGRAADAGWDCARPDVAAAGSARCSSGRAPGAGSRAPDVPGRLRADRYYGRITVRPGRRRRTRRSSSAAATACATCRGAGTCGATPRRGRRPCSTCADGHARSVTLTRSRSTAAAGRSSGSTDARSPAAPPRQRVYRPGATCCIMRLMDRMPNTRPAMPAPMSSSQALNPVAAIRVVISTAPSTGVRHHPGRDCSPSSARAPVTSSLTSRMPP